MLATIQADSYILNIISLLFFCFRLDRILIRFAVKRKFRSFNKQHHRADTATNSQSAAMLDVSSHNCYLVRFADKSMKYCIFEKILAMVLVLKKGASKKEIQSIEKKINNSKGVDTIKYCGKIKLVEDSLSIQKAIRNEW